MPKAFSISAEAIARESQRVGGDLEKFEVARVIQLDECVLRDVGPQDVQLRILAVSGEHNVDHAALADTVNIAESARRQDLPRQQRARRGDRRSDAEVKRFKAGDIVITHCNGEPDIYGYPLRIWAYDQPDSIGWYGEEAVVGDWQLLPAPLALRAQPVGDRRAAAARADRLSPVAARASASSASRSRASSSRA